MGAPSLPWEIGNALVAGVRRKRLSAADVQQAWASYQSVPVRLAHIDAGRAVNLALESGLYAYDGYVLRNRARRRAGAPDPGSGTGTGRTKDRREIAGVLR